MSANDIILLDKLLEQQQATHAPGLSKDRYFELFTASQLLKDADLSYDEVESGIVSGSHDGGIDSIYTFVNGELVHEDMDLDTFRATNAGLSLILTSHSPKRRLAFPRTLSISCGQQPKIFWISRKVSIR